MLHAIEIYWFGLACLIRQKLSAVRVEPTRLNTVFMMPAYSLEL